MTPSTSNGNRAPKWDIDSIFSGGSESKQYKEFCAQIETDLGAAQSKAPGLPGELNDAGRRTWAAWILELQGISERIHLASMFALCLVSQNVDDAGATAWVSHTTELKSKLDIIKATLESFAKSQSDADWDRLMSADGIASIRFYLDEMRRIARIKMSETQEKLALELAVNGYHAWNTLYEKMAGDLRVEVDENGAKKRISLGQNSARLSSPDRAVRHDAFTKMEEAWESRAELAAMTLNAQGGFRLSLYRNRNWESPLDEPLIICRMKRESLDAMWHAIETGGRKIADYVAAKKRFLGIDRFCWYDQDAPVGTIEKSFTFAEAGDFVVEHLGSFSKEMGDFTRMAIDKKWVEAENRAGKRAGAWCSRVPIRKETRVFMTFSENYDSLSTLAHELGHAYHGFVLRDEPAYAQRYPMTLAETASIFNELRVTDAALATAAKREEKLALLDQKLQSAFVFFSNIRARFIFDCRFYAERKKGIVGRAQLDALMTEAQKEAFYGLLDPSDGYHPLFWASKLHFFITDTPFYNFPYTFGFLFAKGVYDRALKEGPSFAKSYRALLSDTGRMTTDEVAQKHLGVDLSKNDFWDAAVARTMADVDEFVALCRK
ncbi:MAG: M3 family oligoendopeptidase [candidate division Zixibacteria bacterium]|nr:M3 family oligoendopeptidase [candidate division Zixibacteria bacterium]